MDYYSIGWVPNQFKSSRTHRAQYSSQNITTFVDVEDVSYRHLEYFLLCVSIIVHVIIG